MSRKTPPTSGLKINSTNWLLLVFVSQNFYLLKSEMQVGLNVLVLPFFLDNTVMPIGLPAYQRHGDDPTLAEHHEGRFYSVPGERCRGKYSSTLFVIHKALVDKLPDDSSNVRLVERFRSKIDNVSSVDAHFKRKKVFCLIEYILVSTEYLIFE